MKFFEKFFGENPEKELLKKVKKAFSEDNFYYQKTKANSNTITIVAKNMDNSLAFSINLENEIISYKIIDTSLNNKTKEKLKNFVKDNSKKEAA